MTTLTYSLNGSQAGSLVNISSTISTQATITGVASTGCRSQTIDFGFGPAGTPATADCSIIYDVSRCTSLGTGGSTATPAILDNVGGNSRNVCTVNQTGSATVAGASLYYQGFSQRASQRMVLREDEFFIGQGATTGTGMSFRAVSSNYTDKIAWQIFFQDLN